MKLICKNRGMGKTYDLIKMSAETGYQIVVHSQSIKKDIIEKAKAMGLSILPPITLKEMNLAQYRNNKFLIDELELFIQDIGSIYAATINKENVIENDDNIIAIMNMSLDTLIREHNKYVNKGDYNTALNIMKNIEMLNKQLETTEYR